MSCAFDLKAMQDYDGIMRGFEVVDHFKRLNIKNINWENEGRYQMFCSIFADDYNEHRANFLAYAKEGMNARVLWELRKSAILWDFMEGSKDPWFFEGHKEGWNKYQIKEYRSNVLGTKFRDYEDHDWQYFWVIDLWYGRDFAYDYFDPEMCFEDGDPYKIDDLGDPPRDLAWRIVPVRSYTPKCRQGTPEWVKPWN